MVRHNLFVGLGAGLMAGALITAAISGGPGVPRAMAQEQPTPRPAAWGRYQVSAWAYAGSSGIAPKHGAYLLDTQSGQLWLTVDGGEAQKIGKVE